MESRPFKFVVGWWSLGSIYYWSTFLIGNPRPLGPAQTTFNTVAILIILLSILGLIRQRNSIINIGIGALAIGHGLGVSAIAYFGSNPPATEGLLRLVFAGPAFFVWVWFLNKIIERQELTACLLKT